MIDNKVELTDEELDIVVGGITNNDEYARKHEIQLGDYVPDAYKPADKNKDPNELDLTRNNILNQNNNIDNNYVPFEYDGKIIK